MEEELRVNAAVKAMKRRQGNYRSPLDLGSEAPAGAKKMTKERSEECREDISAIQNRARKLKPKSSTLIRFKRFWMNLRIS